jgi:hypothetical protein
MKKEETVHERMAIIKNELAKREIKKSGHNKHAGFKYHELSDFMEHINELNYTHGVNDCVHIDEAANECRITLTNVHNPEDNYTIITPFREAQMLSKGGGASNVDAIQRMGSTITYNRRYLYMTAYNIQENDAVDGNEQPKVKQESEPSSAPVKPVPAPTPVKPAPAKKKTITMENFAIGLDKVNKGELMFFKFEETLKQYDLTPEQVAMVKSARENEQLKNEQQKAK